MKSESMGKMTMVSAITAASVPALMPLISVGNKLISSQFGVGIVWLPAVFCVLVFFVSVILTIVGCLNLASRNISTTVRSAARVGGIILLVWASIAVVCAMLASTGFMRPASSGSWSGLGYVILWFFIFGVLTVNIMITSIVIAVRMGCFLSLANKSRRLNR